MWSSVNLPDFGIMHILDGLVTKADGNLSSNLPNLHESSTLLVASDYSGSHKRSKFEAYSFLIISQESWLTWEETRKYIRTKLGFSERRISFKDLNDKQIQKILPYILTAANELNGICVSFVVDRRLNSLFKANGKIDLDDPELSKYRGFYKLQVLEKLLRIVHLVSYFTAGLSRENQNVIWLTDVDDIAANDERTNELANIWSNVICHYLRHDLGNLSCGTTDSDEGTLQIEDLVAIPDLIAGTLCEMLNCYGSTENISYEQITPVPENISFKCRYIGTWLSIQNMPLKRLTYTIEKGERSGTLSIKELTLHGGI